MPTLVLPPRFGPDSNALWRAAVAAGWEVRRATGWQAPPVSGEVVLYGETLFTSLAGPQLGLALLEPPADWLPRLPADLLRRHVRALPFGDVPALAGPVFLKPALDKSFPARVYEDPSELRAWDLPVDTPCLASEPVVWESEYRAFVRDGAVRTVSLYARDGVASGSDELGWPSGQVDPTPFAAEVAARVPLPPGVALDVGVIAGRGWAVVEANPAWSAALYGCDPAEVLLTVARACRRRFH